MKSVAPWKAGLFVLFLAWTGVLGIAFSAAQPGTEALEGNRLKLNWVMKLLSSEKKSLEHVKGEETGLLAELEVLDRDLAAGDQRLELLARQSLDARQQLAQLEKKIQAVRDAVQRIRRHLAGHVRLMYGLGDRGILKVVLSQGSTSRVRQGVLYYGRLIQDRNQQFNQFRDNLQKLSESVQSHEKLLVRVSELTQAELQEQQQRSVKKTQRQKLLSRVREEKLSRQQKVVELDGARLALSTFMERLQGAVSKDAAESVSLGQLRPKEVQEQAQDLSPPELGVAASSRPPNKGPAGRITVRKGKLSPPVQATARKKTPGVFYVVKPESSVTAVYGAQVVYADWFRGYGLLVILNHGEHVFSLYGYNHRLLVSSGDWVGENEAIALSGDTGSLEGVPGLYFEIRQQGRSVDPQRWLLPGRG